MEGHAIVFFQHWSNIVYIKFQSGIPHVINAVRHFMVTQYLYYQYGLTILEWNSNYFLSIVFPYTFPAWHAIQILR